MSWASEYGLFFAKTTTALLAAVVLLSLILQAKKHSRSTPIAFEDISKEHQQRRQKWRKTLGKKHPKEKKADKKRPICYVLTFEGDVQGSATEHFQKQISAILDVATQDDQVLIKITSPGGQVPPYGLAAAQIMRLTEAGLHTHAVVDTVAASGGYLMAAMADRITAAPFALIGSIGVILQAPNFHRLLQDKQIDVEQITAGKYKRNLTLFTHNSEEDRQAAQAQVDKIHKQFIAYVQKKRTHIKEEATEGDVFLAQEALSLGLIDDLGTSEDCIKAACTQFRVWALPPKPTKNKFKHLLSSLHAYFKHPLGL